MQGLKIIGYRLMGRGLATLLFSQFMISASFCAQNIQFQKVNGSSLRATHIDEPINQDEED